MFSLKLLKLGVLGEGIDDDKGRTCSRYLPQPPLPGWPACTLWAPSATQGSALLGWLGGTTTTSLREKNLGPQGPGLQSLPSYPGDSPAAKVEPGLVPTPILPASHHTSVVWCHGSCSTDLHYTSCLLPPPPPPPHSVPLRS
ncbi:hypothetical protein E2C01_087530 [Portunus trituberculatus]|uniref:Uncharacterized protein n=1 Tax=Portunus trituberculatus TaxID=210409 RepID=A0A5B7J3L3_PORTR|nr:hypothetical protein [Portunus trituberculatus]